MLIPIYQGWKYFLLFPSWYFEFMVVLFLKFNGFFFKVFFDDRMKNREKHPSSTFKLRVELRIWSESKLKFLLLKSPWYGGSIETAEVTATFLCLPHHNTSRIYKLLISTLQFTRTSYIIPTVLSSHQYEPVENGLNSKLLMYVVHVTTTYSTK